jgi:cation diffusion facilitator CzcD-associated flavoprotein CzcO
MALEKQEWEWTELMPAQPEIEAYLNYVTHRLELRSHIRFGVRVIGLGFDERHSEWHVDTDRADRFRARVVVAATGCLTVPLRPDIKGLESFAGVSLYTSRFPKEGFDFSGHLVAVVGTGSSAVQAMPIIAGQASSLHVFQRSAAYTRPANNRLLEPGELDAVKADYEGLRARQRAAFGGVLRFGAVAIDATPPTRRILETPIQERLKVLDELGWSAPDGLGRRAGRHGGQPGRPGSVRRTRPLGGQ